MQEGRYPEIFIHFGKQKARGGPSCQVLPCLKISRYMKPKDRKEEMDCSQFLSLIEYSNSFNCKKTDTQIKS